MELRAPLSPTSGDADEPDDDERRSSRMTSPRVSSPRKPASKSADRLLPNEAPPLAVPSPKVRSCDDDVDDDDGRVGLTWGRGVQLGTGRFKYGAESHNFEADESEVWRIHEVSGCQPGRDDDSILIESADHWQSHAKRRAGELFGVHTGRAVMMTSSWVEY
jgi:hypothetical protein